MSVERIRNRFVLAIVSGVVLSACSPSASTAVPPVLAAAPPAAAAPVAPLVTGLPDFTALVDAYGPAVVNVKVAERRASQTRSSQRGQREQAPRSQIEEFMERFGFPGVPGAPGAPDMPRGQPSRGEGSGFIVSPDGYIMTNAHVVRGGANPMPGATTEVTVKLTDRREFPAKIVGFDERTDVAVIKIEATNLPTVKLGDPSKLKPGQWVVAIGSPFGMENSVTAGIVSATSRTLDGSANDRFVPFIQTDVAVNPGNSGGPLFNLNGEVVGINSQIYSQSGGYMGLSFAIPIDMANDVRQQLVSAGRVTRGKIGVRVKAVDALHAEAVGLDRPRGALVSELLKGEPAEKAGIKDGDIILGVNGRPVDSDAALPAMISAIKPGQPAELEVWTDGKVRKVNVRVAELVEADLTAAAGPQGGNRRDGAGPAPAGAEVLGLRVRPLTSDERQQADTDGSLVIEEVDDIAEERGLQPNDIILGVNGRSVKNIAELQAEIKRAGGKAVALWIQRGGDRDFIAVPAR